MRHAVAATVSTEKRDEGKQNSSVGIDDDNDDDVDNNGSSNLVARKKDANSSSSSPRQSALHPTDKHSLKPLRSIRFSSDIESLGEKAKFSTAGVSSSSCSSPSSSSVAVASSSSPPSAPVANSASARQIVSPSRARPRSLRDEEMNDDEDDRDSVEDGGGGSRRLYRRRSGGGGGCGVDVDVAIDDDVDDDIEPEFQGEFDKDDDEGLRVGGSNGRHRRFGFRSDKKGTRRSGTTTAISSVASAAAERDRYRYAAWLVDRCSFWTLLLGYLLAAVLIFVLSAQLAPDDCEQFAPKRILVEECRAARREAVARRGGGGSAGKLRGGGGGGV